MLKLLFNAKYSPKELVKSYLRIAWQNSEKQSEIRPYLLVKRLALNFGVSQPGRYACILSKKAESLLNPSGNGSKRFVVRSISSTLLNVFPSKAIEASELMESLPLAKLPFAI